MVRAVDSLGTGEAIDEMNRLADRQLLTFDQAKKNVGRVQVFDPKAAGRLEQIEQAMGALHSLQKKLSDLSNGPQHTSNVSRK